jgi:NAD-dependent SIR2 family protein deacetylase
MSDKRLFLEECKDYLRNPFTKRCIIAGGDADKYLRRLVHFKNDFIARLLARDISKKHAKLSYRQWKFIARLTDHKPRNAPSIDASIRPPKLSLALLPPVKYLDSHEQKELERILKEMETGKHGKEKKKKKKEKIVESAPRPLQVSPSHQKTPIQHASPKHKSPSISKKTKSLFPSSHSMRKGIVGKKKIMKMPDPQSSPSPSMHVSKFYFKKKNLKQFSPGQPKAKKRKTDACEVKLAKCEKQRRLMHNLLNTLGNPKQGKTKRKQRQPGAESEERNNFDEEAFRKARENVKVKSDDDLKWHANKGQGKDQCNAFVFLLGAGASVDAGINAFRTIEYAKDPYATPIISTAQKSWKKHYMATELKNHKVSHMVDVENITADIEANGKLTCPIERVMNLQLNTNERVMSAERRPQIYMKGGVPSKYPKVLSDVLRKLHGDLKDKTPSHTHKAIETIFKETADGVMLATMNIDGLEWTLDIDPNKIIPLHGNIFVASVLNGGAVPLVGDRTLLDSDYLEISLYGEELYYLTEQVDRLKSALHAGACLVTIGMSSAVVPPIFSGEKINHLIVINPDSRDVKKTINAFNAKSAEAFKTMADFMETYYPAYKERNTLHPTNSDPAVMTNVMAYMKLATSEMSSGSSDDDDDDVSPNDDDDFVDDDA